MAADASLTAGRFTDAMAGHPAGVAVITVADGSRPRGLAVTSLCSYSLEPPSVVLSVSHGSRSYGPLAACAVFGVHLLGQGQDELATVFSSRADDKFAGLDWRWEASVPRLNGSRAFLCCRRAATFVHGDHSILVGAVEAIEQGAAELDPLLYCRRALGWRLAAGGPHM